MIAVRPLSRGVRGPGARLPGGSPPPATVAPPPPPTSQSVIEPSRHRVQQCQSPVSLTPLEMQTRPAARRAIPTHAHRGCGRSRSSAQSMPPPAASTAGGAGVLTATTSGRAERRPISSGVKLSKNLKTPASSAQRPPGPLDHIVDSLSPRQRADMILLQKADARHPPNGLTAEQQFRSYKTQLQADTCISGFEGQAQSPCLRPSRPAHTPDPPASTVRRSRPTL